jgi:hypothetical protein
LTLTVLPDFVLSPLMTAHEYQPFFHRQPDDHAAAVAAFRRLHMYAVSKGDRALAALAILKALQKVENEAELDGDKELRSLILPAWVRTGMWDALAQLLGKAAYRGRSEEFSQSMTRLGTEYRRWALVKKQLIERPRTVYAAAKAAGDIAGGGSYKSLERGYDHIENVLKEANELDARDDDGEPLQLIEARDLIPTQKLEQILDT